MVVKTTKKGSLIYHFINLYFMKTLLAKNKCFILSYTDSLVEVKFIESQIKVLMPIRLFVPSIYIRGGQEFYYEVWLDNGHKFDSIAYIHNDCPSIDCVL
jgi:hypothetical protein